MNYYNEGNFLYTNNNTPKVNGFGQMNVSDPNNGELSYQDNAVQVPLINRLKLGPEYCSIQEWNAAQWLACKFRNPVNRYNQTPYIEHMLHQAMYSGSCWIEVPFLRDNPDMPWIVNEIMTQLGGVLIDVEAYNQVVNTCDVVPYSLILKYRTLTPDIRNVPIFNY